jgi:hypothetical protein
VGGRQRINIHGAIDLETGQTRMIEIETVDALSTIWGLMHKHVTHNKCYAACTKFADATLEFLCEKVPRNWTNLCDSVTDNFRVISPKDFRVMT